ncbi:hypothetical protein HNR00_004951, partial [Methylorubrum rhodinum]|nr:hypothetical protein [Methylorubrum rhodinum]
WTASSLEICNDLNLAHTMPSGAVHPITTGRDIVLGPRITGGFSGFGYAASE